ncbi:hypothetical protein JCM10207_001524 [Rhodosporidiobolus poonsookiae]
MVSFSCENCGDILKKPKLDQHTGRCRGAYFTCIDCNTTFEGTSYRAHTSCMSEEQRYHKSVYKPPKGKGQKAQKQQQQQQAAPAPVAEAPAPAPAPAAAEPATNDKKREREDEPAAAAVAEPKAGEAVKENGSEEEPKKKKSKKEKKKDKKKDKEGDAAAATSEEPKANGAGAEPLAAFLAATVGPLLSSLDVSLLKLREQVVAAAKEKGRPEDAGEIERRLWEGLKVGGKKSKLRGEFA